MSIDISTILFSILNFALLILIIVSVFNVLRYFKKLNKQLDEIEKRIASLEKKQV